MAGRCYAALPMIGLSELDFGHLFWAEAAEWVSS